MMVSNSNSNSNACVFVSAFNDLSVVSDFQMLLCNRIVFGLDLFDIPLRPNGE